MITLMDTDIEFEQQLEVSPLAEAEIAVRYFPMMEVSGDYYDFLPLNEGQAGVAIGDACGKGMGAALLMTSVSTALRTQAQTSPEAVGESLAYLNRVVHRDTLAHQFVTLIYGIWDTNVHTFTYTSAGHPPALHYQAETGLIHNLSIGNTVLGVCEDIEYPTESISLGVGDTVVLYTDGIIEARNESDEILGIHRLREVVAVHGEESSETLATEILSAASRFAHQSWEDDVTLMVIKRIGE